MDNEAISLQSYGGIENKVSYRLYKAECGLPL